MKYPVTLICDLGHTYLVDAAKVIAVEPFRMKAPFTDRRKNDYVMGTRITSAYMLEDTPVQTYLEMESELVAEMIKSALNK